MNLLSIMATTSVGWAQLVEPALRQIFHERYSQGFTDWRGVYGTTFPPGISGNDPLEDAIDKAIEELRRYHA